MDPTANLEEQRRIVAWIFAYDDRGDHLDEATKTFLQEYEQKVSRLAELVQALDEWIRKGGFLPMQWKR